MLVVGDTLWLFTGEDAGPDLKGSDMRNWCVFSTTDLINWTEHSTPLSIQDFEWAKHRGKAYASHEIGRASCRERVLRLV